MSDGNQCDSFKSFLSRFCGAYDPSLCTAPSESLPFCDAVLFLLFMCSISECKRQFTMLFFLCGQERRAEKFCRYDFRRICSQHVSVAQYMLQWGSSGICTAYNVQRIPDSLKASWRRAIVSEPHFRCYCENFWIGWKLCDVQARKTRIFCRKRKTCARQNERGNKLR